MVRPISNTGTSRIALPQRHPLLIPGNLLNSLSLVEAHAQDRHCRALKYLILITKVTGDCGKVHRAPPWAAWNSLACRHCGNERREPSKRIAAFAHFIPSDSPSGNRSLHPVHHSPRRQGAPGLHMGTEYCDGKDRLS